MMTSKHLRNKSPTRNSLGVGSLVYIPSQVKLVRYDANMVTTQFQSLLEPVVVPIVGIENDRRAPSMVRVHYDGGTWWASDKDLYEVDEDSLGSSMK